MQMMTKIDNAALAVDGTHLAAGVRPRYGALDIARAANEWLGEIVDAYRRRRRAARMHDALRALDDRMLRDLGFSRDEISSVTAEAVGDAERTRLNVLQSPLGL
jgi:uncharacterized protein YjiS (DUF1127 family)